MAINPWLQAAGAAAASAPARAVYGSILRNARIPTTGQQFPIRLPGGYTRAGGAADSNVTYGEDIPQELPPSEIGESAEAAIERYRRGERPPTESNAPTTPANGSPAPGARTQNQQGESPEMLDALREFQANLRAQHMTTDPPQQQLSVLDMLRKRMQSQIDDESNQRLREIGIGMLRSRSPNFFTALGEGFETAETGSRARMDRLRQLAEVERQERALNVEEARRQEELRIREAAQAAEAPLRAAQTRYYLSRADADPTGVAFTRAENAARGAASAAAERAVQAENNRRSRAVPPLPPLTAAEATALRNTTFQQGLIERGFTAPAGAAAAPATTAAPAVPAVRIDASGREIR